MTSPLVLLDLDGTLIDSIPGITASLAVAFRRCGLPVPTAAELRTFVGPPIGDSLRAHGVPEDRVDEVRPGRTARASDRPGCTTRPVYDGIPALLTDLRAAGCRLVVATSKPEVVRRARSATDSGSPRSSTGSSVRRSTSPAPRRTSSRGRWRLTADARPAASWSGDREHDVHGAQRARHRHASG